MYDKMKETTDAKVSKMETIKKETQKMNGRLNRVEKLIGRKERGRGAKKRRSKKEIAYWLNHDRETAVYLIGTLVPGRNILFIPSFTV
jgi:hypothetical protein